MDTGTFHSPTGNPFYNVNFIDLQPMFDGFKNFFGHGVNYSATLNAVHLIMIILSLFFLTLIAYCSVRLLEIRKKEHEHLHHEIEEFAHHHKAKIEKKRQENEISRNPRWVQVLNYVFSENPGDWKLAIIESDAMLEDLMESLGFRGEGLGEKLKSADQESFPTLTRAWEVHAIRNRVAHEGMAFEISHHEAKRVVAVYEQIFRNYGFI